MALSLVLPLRAPLPGATDLSATPIAHRTTPCSDGQMEQTFSPDAGSPARTVLLLDQEGEQSLGAQAHWSLVTGHWAACSWWTPLSSAASA